MARWAVLLGLLIVGIASVLADSEAVAKDSDVLVITADTFDQAVKDHSFLVVEFFAPWSSDPLLVAQRRKRLVKACFHG